LNGVWGPGPMLSGVWGPDPKRFFFGASAFWRLGPRPRVEWCLGPRPQTLFFRRFRVLSTPLSLPAPASVRSSGARGWTALRAPLRTARRRERGLGGGPRSSKRSPQRETRAQRQGVNLGPLRAPGRVHTAASSWRRARIAHTPRPSVGAATFARIRRCRTA